MPKIGSPRCEHNNGSCAIGLLGDCIRKRWRCKRSHSNNDGRNPCEMAPVQPRCPTSAEDPVWNQLAYPHTGANAPNHNQQRKWRERGRRVQVDGSQYGQHHPRQRCAGDLKSSVVEGEHKEQPSRSKRRRCLDDRGDHEHGQSLRNTRR